MATKNTFFFDTYAIIEIANGSENYKAYLDATPILTKLNLFELFYFFLREAGREKSMFYLLQYGQFAVDFDEGDIDKAGALKLTNKKLSMADCIGYIVALKNNVKFLTGDREFREIKNVEFVK